MQAESNHGEEKAQYWTYNREVQFKLMIPDFKGLPEAVDGEEEELEDGGGGTAHF